MTHIIGIILLVILAIIGVFAAVTGFIMIVFEREASGFDDRPRPLDPAGPVTLAVGCALIVIAVGFLQ